MPNDAKKIQEANVTSFLYDKLMRVFGEGSQLFTMEMPGRTLNQLDYAWQWWNCPNWKCRRLQSDGIRYELGMVIIRNNPKAGSNAK